MDQAEIHAEFFLWKARHTSLNPNRHKHTTQCTSNKSTLIRRVASFSSLLRAHSKLSTSSMNTTAGCLKAATANKVRTVFSPSPIHLLMSDEAEIEKKVAPDWCAIALPMRVLPVSCICWCEFECKEDEMIMHKNKIQVCAEFFRCSTLSAKSKENTFTPCF